MEDYIIKLVVFGVISWSATFLLTRRIFPKLSFDFCNRVVSVIHATSAVILSCLSVQDWRCPVCPLASKSSPIQCASPVFVASTVKRAVGRYSSNDSLWSNAMFCPSFVDSRFWSVLVFGLGWCWLIAQRKILTLEHRIQMQTLAMSLGYMIYDLACCLLNKQLQFDDSIHHLVSIIGFGAGLAYEKCGSEIIAALWITEISSPFLHLRELIKELGYKDTDLNLVADISFAVIFTFARMVGGPYLTYLTLSANNPLLIKGMAVGLQLVSAFWFYKIARMVKYKLTRRSKSGELAQPHKQPTP